MTAIKNIVVTRQMAEAVNGFFNKEIIPLDTVGTREFYNAVPGDGIIHVSDVAVANGAPNDYHLAVEGNMSGIFKFAPKNKEKPVSRLWSNAAEGYSKVRILTAALYGKNELGDVTLTPAEIGQIKGLRQAMGIMHVPDRRIYPPYIMDAGEIPANGLANLFLGTFDLDDSGAFSASEIGAIVLETSSDPNHPNYMDAILGMFDLSLDHDSVVDGFDQKIIKMPDDCVLNFYRGLPDNVRVPLAGLVDCSDRGPFFELLLERVPDLILSDSLRAHIASDKDGRKAAKELAEAPEEVRLKMLELIESVVPEYAAILRNLLELEGINLQRR